MTKLNIALTIAGTDPTGGAGIMADLKSFQARGVYGMAVVTSVVAQNTIGVQKIHNVPLDILDAQLNSVFSDITPNAIKTGMLANVEIMEVVKKYLSEDIAYVVDPVMVATSGAKLISDEACEVLIEKLIPLARVITPNIPEAEYISGETIKSTEDMERVAKQIGDKHGVAVLLKGGHSISDADDVLYENGNFRWFKGERINTSNTHGTGCVLSSAIASNLAKGMELEDAIVRAKEYISGALASGLDLGAGSGPLDHGFDLKSRFI